MSFRQSGGGGGRRVKKVMTQPIHLIFRYLQEVCSGASEAVRRRRLMLRSLLLEFLNFAKLCFFFACLAQGTPIRIWLYENTALFMEGTIVGFDEYMNIVLDNAAEVLARSGDRKELGRILLKGDTITLIQAQPVQQPA
uniref:Small nuclear ribonucleoprotein E n=1 Tax=Pinguiococcus pyrenoidosus TaxID=172671 RepID=A0A7R9UCX6_9STRA|mmetsp:Transcript_5986/g.23250  ORF Transcript_5986/g.23250 Transcript_5986/m.23250 type:complete len:139 (+) Transcript_5986:160-576(+)